ncbi:hypothetical protein KAFR_0E03450 [Kazachstania africana CBS 2517]|uniref:ABC transporter domain-containing protein n=1 Tax=Kazachstania africana (strain ATCC 22294 / BCRC 22015 / CBS 2517 / CECT 1963 / NBRC 1671 / NRRL Y-8276) TaxID=1071382 RepID=H2AVU7_KAZAF|nr:hypothetical protein KAFR_0E03450 [Kazachstania africana CBS 2517]CCF58497.1 hypothetical protein KAFR_0E03450 [Kazachstania africana CBS 2517]
MSIPISMEFNNSGDTSSVDSHQSSSPSETQNEAERYMGFDEKTQEQIKKLAETFTQASIANAASAKQSPLDVESDASDTHSVFTIGSQRRGINPIVTDPNSQDYDPALDPQNDKFSSRAWVKNLANLSHMNPDYYKPYSIGCAWKNLTASGDSADVSYQSTVANLPVKLLGKLYRRCRKTRESDTFQILKRMDGCIKPGELLVVLGRPGSGCTTLLKSISSNTHGFKISKDTSISYSGLTPKEIKKHYRGDVVYQAESDIHLPHLTVYQTLVTVSRLKTPQNRFEGTGREEFANHLTDVAMATYGLLQTRNTKVGNEYVRGVSGGERKRVSIAEVWICGSKFQCWDNATRGLDAATALEFVRALKTQAEIANTAATVAIYQCSQDAYDLFDKVCVLYEGYQIYFGSAKRAKQYFIDMGYVCPARQTTADFLTSITSPAERIVNQDFVNQGKNVPQTPKEMNDYWMSAQEYKYLMGDVDLALHESNVEFKEEIMEAHIAEQSKRLRKGSPYVVNYGMQIKYLLIRNVWRMVNSPSVTMFQVFGNSAMAFILGSMFYKVMLHTSTDTFYYRGAAMFFAILFNSFQSLLEIFKLYEARPITEKHRTYALYHPSADAFASVISEIPPKLATAIMFNIVFYFLVDFRRNGGVFFFYFLVSIVSVFVMSHIFRCVGSMTKTLQEAMVPASILLLAMSMYIGFVIPETKMLRWSKWIWYINPLSYLFESLMVNEFHGVWYPCSTFIPRGPSYVNATGTERVCAVVGAIPGYTKVLGDDYLSGSYNYQHKHKWRGFGIGIGYIVFFLIVYLILCEYNEGAKQKGEMLIMPHKVVRRLRHKGQINDRNSNNKHNDEEQLAYSNESTLSNTKVLSESLFEHSSENTKYNETLSSSNSFSGEIANDEDNVGISKSEAIFHWRDLCYDVQIKSETRRLLNNVDGWVKPGTLTALMGASGAGKTTLLDCLAERVTMGVITGNIFVDGRLRDESFPRSIGYCQQQDLHLKTATVRESLRFSAYLRQPASVTKEEKDHYVEQVIKILEMETYADAVVGVPGEGLNVEQRKRLTIGVELAAKPKLLVFLDEPTSGLDSQTAWATCQLMRKLANHGQAILCTIHQPSAILMQEFDRLLFLQKGGKTVYFGDLGKGCKTMIEYFEKHGAQACPPDANPAEWMLEVIGAAPGSHALQDYYDVWINSEEYKAVHRELDRMEKELPLKTKEAESEEKKEFATNIFHQFILVSIRLFEQYWRSPEYLWSKFILTVLNQLFIGFTFFKADHSLQGLQNQMLSVFMYTVILLPMIQQYLPTYVSQRDLYEARERPSRTFSWKAFFCAQIVVEIPWNILAGTLAFIIYYYEIGFYINASEANQLHERGALFWLITTAFYTYIGSMAIGCISFLEIADNAAHLSILLFAMALSFCGVMVQKSYLPRFWIFMYRVSPVTYLIDALLSVGVANVDVRCASYEYVVFTPPSGMTCGQYMEPYLLLAGTGYLADTNATTECQFCEYSRTNDYLKLVGSSYGRRWRNYGIFICFIVFNYAFAIFAYWLARVPKRTGQISQVSKK